jgi:hypothetical protein
LRMEGLGAETRQVWVAEILPAASFVSPFADGTFAVMVAAFGPAPLEDKRRLARSLVQQGCRVAVCAGADCDEWETVFDDVAVEESPVREASRFVMTTSHKDESLEEVAEFLFTCTAIEGRVPERFVVLTLTAQVTDQQAVRDTIARVLAALPNPPLQRT